MARPRSQLQRLIATWVVDALAARQHFRVSHGSHRALVDDVETAVGPLLPSVAPYWLAPRALRRRRREQDAEEALLVMADAIGERLSRSNHLDDIFADDARIRRDALKATREVLARVASGQAPIDEWVEGEGFTVQLDALGYLAAAAASHAGPDLVRKTLMKAARRGQAVLERYDAAERVAVFCAGGSRPCLLDVEDAIASELGLLVAAGRIALPAVERIVRLPEAARQDARAAFAASKTAIERSVRCRASCERVGPMDFRVTLTPLSAEAAEQAERHCAQLIATLRRALRGAARGAAAAPASEERLIGGAAARQTKALVPASGRRGGGKRRPSKRTARQG